MLYTDFKETVGEGGAKSFACNACGKAFKKHELFGQHYRTVHLNRKPKKLRVCPYCDVEVSPHMRAFHLEQAHGEPAPCCGACGKKFAFPGQVLRHQKFHHMGEREHRCDSCEMTFACRWKLREHQKKHRPDCRPFRCEVCEKCFRWRNNLKTHMNTHTNSKPHACKLCGEGFAQHASLSYHVKRVHSDA